MDGENAAAVVRREARAAEVSSCSFAVPLVQAVPPGLSLRRQPGHSGILEPQFYSQRLDLVLQMLVLSHDSSRKRHRQLLF